MIEWRDYDSCSRICLGIFNVDINKVKVNDGWRNERWRAEYYLVNGLNQRFTQTIPGAWASRDDAKKEALDALRKILLSGVELIDEVLS